MILGKRVRDPQTCPTAPNKRTVETGAHQSYHEGVGNKRKHAHTPECHGREKKPRIVSEVEDRIRHTYFVHLHQYQEKIAQLERLVKFQQEEINEYRRFFNKTSQ